MSARFDPEIVAFHQRFSLAFRCLGYLLAYESGHHEASRAACERYGREAGRRSLAPYFIPHAGYWFEDAQ